MEPAVAGALYAAESLVTGAVALAKGITHPTLPLKANLTHITSVNVPRAHHTISVIKGRAYIFGGEVEPGILANNDMQIVILPSSGVLEADYTSIAAHPTQHGGEVPQSRKGHTAVVVGDNIYVFGGEGVEPEKGRVWVYSTISNSWSHLDPPSDTLSPSQCTGHAAVGSDMPGPKDVVYQERAPQQPADPAKAVPEPAEDNSWGTMFVLGGRDTQTRELLDDSLAFDIRSRTWSNIPNPSGAPREGASLALAGNCLYRFGGSGTQKPGAGTAECLDVSPVWKHAEGGTTPLTSGWAWEEVSVSEGKAPQSRSSAGLITVTTGQGRHYLLVVGGEDLGSGFDDGGSGFLDDIWAFQLPSERPSGAAAKDQMKAAVKRHTHEGSWAQAEYSYVDAKGEEEKETLGEVKQGLGDRCHFALAKGTEVDGATAAIWGGVDGNGRILGDGWLLTMDR